MCGEMECWSAGWGWCRLGRIAVLVASGWVDAPPHLQKKKSGGSIQLPWCPPFYLSTYQTKSNPDMRNSKLAHTQAGF